MRAGSGAHFLFVQIYLLRNRMIKFRITVSKMDSTIELMIGK